MKDNKLIAEFMGRGGTFNHDKTMICTGIYPDTMTLMKYHTSWDWLIPVVQKIEEECEGVPEQLLDFSFYDEVGDVHKAVVEFINEHNKYICGSCREHCSEYTYSEDRDVDECNNCKTYNNEK